MPNWIYQNGLIVAYNPAGSVLCVFSAQPMFMFFVDLLNTNQQLSNLILARLGKPSSPNPSGIAV